mmetsp:Transcript_22340/g.55360  ORF Transcript_22340/g.55360 Transcript_22340/m.55360 type:complete len:333 (-) Transcript_22340:435-1433(-)
MMAMRLRSTTLGRKRISTLQNPSTHQCHKQQTNLSRKFSSSSGSSSSSSSTGFFGRAWDKYTEALIARPLLVKGGAAAVIFTFSDTATQKIMDPESEWDASRALSGAGFGVVATCWLHYWWGFLEVVINKRMPVGSYGQNKLVNALGKVVADQLVGAPLYIYGYYCVTHFGTEFQSQMAEQKKDSEEIQESTKTKTTTTTTKSTEESPDTSSIVITLMKETSDRALEMLPDTLLRHWTLWPIVHTWNFYYNPIHHRVLVQNIVLIFWSGYLSHLNNGGLEIVTPEKEIEMVAAEHEQQRRETKNKTTTTKTKTKTAATDKSGMQLATSGRTH